MKAYQTVYESGTQWRDRDFFCNALTSRKLKLKPKAANIAGLQLADLLAYPSKQEILKSERRIDRLASFCKQICQTVQDKYNQHIHHGKVEGYGKIFLK